MRATKRWRLEPYKDTRRPFHVVIKRPERGGGPKAVMARPTPPFTLALCVPACHIICPSVSTHAIHGIDCNMKVTIGLFGYRMYKSACRCQEVPRSRVNAIIWLWCILALPYPFARGHMFPPPPRFTHPSFACSAGNVPCQTGCPRVRLQRQLLERSKRALHQKLEQKSAKLCIYLPFSYIQALTLLQTLPYSHISRFQVWGRDLN